VAEKRIDLRAGDVSDVSEYDTDEDAAIGPESAIGRLKLNAKVLPTAPVRRPH